MNRAQSAALIVYGGFAARVGGAHSITTKSTSEALGIPTPEYNAEGLVLTRMGIYLARDIKLNGTQEYEFEKDMICREVRSIMDKILEMGDGDVAVGTIKAFETGVMDIPWSPNRECKCLMTSARDDRGYIRVLDPGNMPYPKDVLEYHEERLRAQSKKVDKPYGPDLAIDSVFEFSKEIADLMPYPFKP